MLQLRAISRDTEITAILSRCLTSFACLRLVVAVVVDDLSVGDGSRVLNDAAADGVDPLLLLLLRVGDEVHGLGGGGELEGELAVEHVLGALDGEAGGDGDDAAGDRGPRHGGVLEPEEPTLLEHEPPPPPRLDILALLVQPPRPLRPVPELHAGPRVAARRRGVAGAHQRAPQACCHRAGGLGDRGVGFRRGRLVKVDSSVVGNWSLRAGFRRRG
jgi:hypothetical protein